MIKTIPLRFSLYLDVLRIGAALTVLLDHASGVFTFAWPGGIGHHAVIVFFVLSGYVISHVADTRETSGRIFVSARLARLWSVVAPAMALTVVCDVIGRTYGPLAADAYAWSPIDHPAIRVGSALTFTNESWVSIQPLSNFPMWSLALEFWYYLAFAAWTFLPRRWKTAAAILMLVASGPRGILLFPVWAMGAALQRRPAIQSAAAGIALLALGLLLVVWLISSGVYSDAHRLNATVFAPWVRHQLAEARLFWFDWITGLALTLHLAGARVALAKLPLEWLRRPIRWCAGISFAAYLFHMPLLHLLAAFLPRSQAALAIGITLAAIALLGPAAERSKQVWRRAIDRVIEFLSSAGIRAA